MKQTEKMGLNVLIDYLEGNIHETIKEFNNNFSKIDSFYEEKIDSLNELVIGKTYDKSLKYWNKNPWVGEPVGWVNLRKGNYANKWKENHLYSIGDIIVPNNDNGHLYRCVSRGKSFLEEPFFTTEEDSEIWDLKNVAPWLEEHNYSVGDVVIPTTGSKTYHYRCIVEGLSDIEEPEWSTQEGVSFIDGSVTWLVEKTVKWKEDGGACLFKPFGIIGE